MNEGSDAKRAENVAEATEPQNKKRKREFSFSRFPKRRIAILFLYYGWEFDGLVCQDTTLNTVEEELSKALVKTRLIESWKTCQYSRSGRTDKEVSAFKQVASLIVRSVAPTGEYVFWPEDADPEYRIKGLNSELEFVKMLNSALPKTIRVLAWAPVPLDFSARFHCNRRVYKYGFPLADHDLEAMKDACTRLVGEHDFRNLCRIDMNVNRLEMSYVRTIFSAEISVVADDSRKDRDSHRSDQRPPYGFAELTIKASGFLWHQIRCIVALLYGIGQRKELPEVITALLDIEKFPRRPAYGLAAATPLYLFDCSYDNMDLQWNWDLLSVRNVRNQLLNSYATFRTRCLMLQNMVEEIGGMVPDVRFDYEGFSNFIAPFGDSSRTYVPLRKRPTCESLEEKREKVQIKKKALLNRMSAVCSDCGECDAKNSNAELK